ncbi:MAG: PTS sugar transporter subunit IIA [Puniceicoccales bacterium]|jgi:mannitol/fructose-specific phosphotransferase system IIA component (Ntr-type)|nr:PTS sugar transporter subunit IIA [Puniceicoccales bacterium]
MPAILDALLGNRLVSFSADCLKNDALSVLAGQIAPCLPEVVREVLDKETGGLAAAFLRREADFNTALGDGLAVPHLRIEGENAPLFTAVGWSKTGLDYGAADGLPVHLVVLFCIPDSRKDDYLREMRALMRAVLRQNIIPALAAAPDLAAVRNILSPS